MQRTLLRLGLVIAFLASAISVFQSNFAFGEAQSHNVPLGLPADTWLHFVPRQNPQTAAKVELGRKLFFDKRLSADGTVACATCHQPERAFADDKPVAEGVLKRRGTRNSPSILNVIYNNGQFWDGRSDTLEEQAVLPLINPLEMGDQTHDDVIARLRALPEYVTAFQQTFGKPTINIMLVGNAISAFERTLLSGAAPLDRYLAGNKVALNDAELRGMAVFRGRGRCTRCHTMNEHRMLFSDYEYRNTGVAARHPEFEKLARQLFHASDDELPQLVKQLASQPGGSELGRMLVSHHILDVGSFHTPSLRNVALTPPYFHDGSAATLADVVKFYNEGGKDNLNLDTELHPLGLTEEEQRDLVTFLGALTGSQPQVAQPLSAMRNRRMN
ncbi:MAG: cytochrome-c peroxidase [Acidobacteria bacterium]|nr:cytochrome-c peroxidase [Acidobacteriota bacterium]